MLNTIKQIEENKIIVIVRGVAKEKLIPLAEEAIIKESKAQGLVSIPGAITPSEAAAASRAGADFVKMFPIDFYGPRYLKTVATPLSHVRFLAVNGINENNMNEYLEAGACGVGVGSGIVNKKLIE